MPPRIAMGQRGPPEHSLLNRGGIFRDEPGLASKNETSDSSPTQCPMRTFDLAEAASFLRMNAEELRQRAKAGRIPGAKIGRRWVFLEDDLVAHVRALYSHPRQALQVTPRKELECHFANAAVSGGSTSSLPTGSEYEDLLGLPTKPKRRSIHDRLKSELWRLDKLEEKPRRTWNEAVVRWLKEQSHKATAKEDVSKLRWLDHLSSRQRADDNQSRNDRPDHRSEACARAAAMRRSIGVWHCCARFCGSA